MSSPIPTPQIEHREIADSLQEIERGDRYEWGTTERKESNDLLDGDNGDLIRRQIASCPSPTITTEQGLVFRCVTLADFLIEHHSDNFGFY